MIGMHVMILMRTMFAFVFHCTVVFSFCMTTWLIFNSQVLFENQSICASPSFNIRPVIAPQFLPRMDKCSRKTIYPTADVACLAFKSYKVNKPYCFIRPLLIKHLRLPWNDTRLRRYDRLVHRLCSAPFRVLHVFHILPRTRHKSQHKHDKVMQHAVHL